MDKEYLLTYQDSKGLTFSWFDTEEEMNDFVESRTDIHVIEGIKLVVTEQII